ncbi:hypothetical protein K7432_012674 [Basidiobolus ranarum]|uniref:Bromodomain associated domain-containing protein n=1 Tax=Basidiobolus ranarum TaxID=34480 RepID=A0ABR2WKJ2_9FUNG
MTTLHYLEYYKRFIAIICRQAGFKGISSTALESLADITLLYMKEVLVSAHGYAELASRTQPNIADITHAFTELRIDIGQLIEFNLQMEQITIEMKDRTNRSNKLKKKLNKIDEESKVEKEVLVPENVIIEENTIATFPEYIPSHLPPLPTLLSESELEVLSLPKKP